MTFQVFHDLYEPWEIKQPLVISCGIGDQKKRGSQRFCVDYQEVNAATVKDVYPLPWKDNSLSALFGAKWFSTLDLASGYWQVPMDPASSCKAAFVTTSRLYEWTVMPTSSVC